MSAFKTRSELRLAELEAINRPLTEEEADELRKCLHAIYMRQWRAEQAEREMNERALREHGISPESLARIEIDGISRRMEAAFDPEWPLPSCSAEQWEEAARVGSEMLLAALLRMHDRELEAA